MHRRELYVTVTQREWGAYQLAVPRSVDKRLRHIDIFYSGRTVHTSRRDRVVDNGRISLDVLCPVLDGAIPAGHAIGEPDYRMHTPPCIRAEGREQVRQDANTRARAL